METVRGTIRRRILVNFRVDPAVALGNLPQGFVPKLVGGHAVAGVCLIRLEHERPGLLRAAIGLSSENAAHRFAAYRIDERGERHECVYIARRHTGSRVTLALGGRIFPGDHRPARFAVRDEDGKIDLAMTASDGFAVRLRARRAASLPAESVFASLDQASSFFRGGSLGYSETRAGTTLDGLYLRTARWQVTPLEVELAHSSYFDDRTVFPAGSVAFDCALLMTDIEHEWQRADCVRDVARRSA